MIAEFAGVKQYGKSFPKNGEIKLIQVDV